MKKLLSVLLIAITAFLGVNHFYKVQINAATSSGVTYVQDGDRIYVHFGAATDSNHFTEISEVHTLFSGADVTFDWQSGYEYFSSPNLIGYQNQYENIMDFMALYGSTGTTYEYFGDSNNVEGSVGDGYFYSTNETVGVTKVSDGQNIYVHFDTATNATTHVTSRTHSWFRTHQDSNNYIRFTAPNTYSKFIIKNAQNNAILQETSTYFDNFYINIDSPDGVSTASIYDISDTEDTILTDVTSYTDILIYFEVESSPITASDAEYVIDGNRAYLGFNGNTLIDVNNLAATPDTFEINLPADVIGLYIADEFGSVIFDWNNTGFDLELPNVNGYDNLWISTQSSGLNIDIEGVDPYLTQMLVVYDEGLFAYGVEGYSKFYIYFELIPFDNVDPIIEGDTLVVNIDSPLTEAVLRAEISAWDDLDGDITADLVYEGGTYESARLAGTLVVGNTYTIIYSVEDSSGNVTQASINVEVVDITKPVFGITNTTTEISYTQTLNLESFKANLLASDNYDDSEDLVINILTDTYTANKLVPGTYTVVYRAIDTSTNYRDITITVEVIDNVGPVITGPNNFNVPLSPKTNISVILQQFTASDAIDGDVTSSIEVLSDDYTAAATPGIYSVTIRFSDSSGNTTNKMFTITMADGVPPILFITSGLLIGVNELQTLTVEQIITLLETQGSITGFTVLSNTYAGNENTPGTYQMVVEYTQNNVQYQHTLSILVTPSQLLQWTVSFITNGGSNLASVIVNDFGQLLIQAPSRTGYRFVGWYKDAELTQPFSMVTGRITEDTTLYAKWVPNATGVPSVIIDNISNLKLVDVVLIVGTIALSIGIGFVVANKKKPTSKRKRG